MQIFKVIIKENQIPLLEVLEDADVLRARFPCFLLVRDLDLLLLDE